MSSHVVDGRSGRKRRELEFGDTALDEVTGTRLLVEASTMEKQGDFPRAMKLYERASEVDELAALALERKARVLRRVGELRRAASTLTRALHYCVNDLDRSQALYLELGDVHGQLEDYSEACYYYRRALVLAPDNAEVRERLRRALNLACGVPAESA